jgi:Tfp pilus assembly protein FimT
MPRQSPQSNPRMRRLSGFSTVELVAVATVLAIITAFGLIGISKARASVRLSGAARQYASYIEKARIYSIKRHADDAAQRASVAINANQTSYDVTMDLDGDGGTDTRTINLPSGVTFQTVETVAFDWRGRTWRTANGITESNAQVSIRLLSSDDAISVDVTGSGDVTIDSRVFDDSVPNVSLHVGDLSASASPAATPVSGGTPAAGASPSPNASPIAGVIPSPSPILDGGVGGVLPTPTPTPGASPSATATPTPSPSPVATPTPSPSPTPALVCSITADPIAVVMGLDSTTTVKVSHNANTTVSISGSSSKPSDLQVTPGGNQSLGAGSYTLFTLKSKRNLGAYSVTFTASCGSKVVPVVVGL